MVLCGIKKLLYDEACLKVFNNGNRTVEMFGQSSECYKCYYQSLAFIPKNQVKNLIISTKHSFLYQASSGSYNFCNGEYFFQQHGVYGLNVSDYLCPKDVYVISNPDDTLKPLWWELIIFLVIAILAAVGTFAGNSQWLKQFFRSDYARELENDLGTPNTDTDDVPLVQSEITPVINRFRARMKSLDAFRGLTIALMIFVNYGGGKYWFFNHSPWNGLTLADLVFPWFAWIMGASIIMSIRSQLRDRVSRQQIFLRCLRRSLSLIILGLILNSRTNNNIYTLRFLGVLQRLGLSYFIVASVESFFMEPQNSNQNYGRFMMFKDLISCWIQWLIMIFIAIAHYCLTMYLHVEDYCPLGYLGPGGLHDYGKYENCTGGAAGYIDRLIIHPAHMRNFSTASEIYNTSISFDPEGILGTLNTAVLVFLGAQAGRIILHYSDTSGRIKRWVIWAVLTGLFGGQLCNWHQEGGPIPINKNLWSLSFVMVTACLAFLMLSILLLIIDHTKWWSGSPFQEAGKNSILIYVGSEMTKKMLPWTWEPVFDKTSHAEFLTMHTWATYLWLAIAIILNKNEVYITI